MKPIKRALLLGFLLESILIALFFLFPLVQSPIGSTILLVHIPAMIAIGSFLNLFELTQIPWLGSANACASVVAMALCWSGIFYAANRVGTYFGRARRNSPAGSAGQR